MPYMTYSQLKDSARARMTPVMGKLIGATAILYGLMLVASQFSSVSGIFINSFALQMILFFFFSILGNILSEMLNIGFHYLMLKLYCGRPVSASDVFYAFTSQTKTCLLLSSFISVISIVPLMPFYIFIERFGTSLENTDLAIALFCYTPALVLTTILGLVYSQAYYLMLDFPSYSVKELLRNSRLLMRGHKGRLFYIQVCMLPIILIGCLLTCGLGLLWITPFAYAVETEFYLDLVTKRGR